MQPNSMILGFSTAVAITVGGCAANGAAPTTGSLPLGSVMNLGRPHYFPTRFSAPRARTSSQGVHYNGGAVLLHPKIYLILWGYKTYGDPHKVARLLTDYFKAMGGSGHNNIYTQYYEMVSSSTLYITNEKNQLGGVWYDQTNPVPSSPTDAQVALEAVAGAIYFGGADPNGSYVVATPHGRSTSGFGTQWCAYHGDTSSSSILLSYTNLPYMPDAKGNCGGNGIPPPKDESRADEGVTIVAGAEEGDSVTDPGLGTGWYGSNFGEISDACAWFDIQNDRFGKRSYTMGPMWSNASNQCVQTYK